MNAQHNVAVRIGGKIIEKWTNYSIASDMLTPADQFQMAVGGVGPEAYHLCAPDSPVEVLVDDVTILSGRIDSRRRRVARPDGATLAITGRDKAGRLVDESMELKNLDSLNIEQYVRTVVGDWFPEVIFSNAVNRERLTGVNVRAVKASKAKAHRAVDDEHHETVRKVQPGEGRWQVLQELLAEVGVMAWSSADGRSIIVGQPDYEQVAKFSFFLPKPGSDRAREGNVKDIEIVDDVSQRYSQITAMGAGRGDATKYGPELQRADVVKDGPGLYGVGKDFSAPKRLIVADHGIRTPAQAAVRAKREMAERDGAGHTIEITAAGHSQVITTGAPRPLVFAFDTLAMVEDEEIGLRGLYLITSVAFSRDRGQGELTHMRLVRKGTVLRT